MAEGLYVALGAVVGAVATVLIDRGLRWRRPRVSVETGNLARRSVNSARRVFGGATALGGQQAYPWVTDDETLHKDRLADDLRQAAARVNNRPFSAQVADITTHLRGVYAAPPGPSMPFIISGDPRPETPSEREWRKSNERKAAKQREHAEAGMACVEPALTVLDKLERHF